jgi:hypothetical protein
MSSRTFGAPAEQEEGGRNSVEEDNPSNVYHHNPAIDRNAGGRFKGREWINRFRSTTVHEKPIDPKKIKQKTSERSATVAEQSASTIAKHLKRVCDELEARSNISFFKKRFRD